MAHGTQRLSVSHTASHFSATQLCRLHWQAACRHGVLCQQASLELARCALHYGCAHVCNTGAGKERDRKSTNSRAGRARVTQAACSVGAFHALAGAGGQAAAGAASTPSLPTGCRREGRVVDMGCLVCGAAPGSAAALYVGGDHPWDP